MIISVTGLGYVGLPLAVAFSKHFKVIGFDLSSNRIEELSTGFDRSGDVPPDVLKACSIEWSSDPSVLAQATFHVVAVPTPIDTAKKPDLRRLLNASEAIGKHLKPDDVVVFESTVYPGVTEEECLPVLEKFSKLKAGADFHLGYSPERINPGDKEHMLSNVTKIVAGQTAEALERIAAVYEKVVDVGLHRASSIKVAEAAKVIENTQRDLNVALMNELAIIFQRLQIDTNEVLEAAGTKWNFLPFKPGLVGGHCIGVDPYYLTYKAEQLNYHPEVILAGRRINDQMGHFIANQTIRQMIHHGLSIKNAKVAVLGITFKEDCPDIRNSRAIDIISELKAFGVQVLVHDPVANQHEVQEEYNVELIDWEMMPKVDAMIIAVAHQKYRHFVTESYADKLLPQGVMVDVKSILDRKAFEERGIPLWRL